MNAIVEGIIGKLTVLPRDDVDAVRLRINSLLAFGKWGGSAKNADALRVYDLIRREMQSAGLIASREATPYNRLPNRSSFDTKAQQLISFLETQHTQQCVQDGILRVGLELLINNLRRFVGQGNLAGEAVVSVAMVARNIHLIPARLDRAFPGYAGAGLLHLLVKDGR